MKNLLRKPRCPFVNAQKRAEKFPKTFEVPTQKELKKQRVGSVVKISTGRERFWVEIKKIHSGLITGRIDNVLILMVEHGLQYGDYVQFRFENIFQTE